MELGYVLLFAIIVTLVALIIVRLKYKSERISDYFCNAVRVYAITGNADARLAAIAAAKVAGREHRLSMLTYLHGVAFDIKQASEKDPEMKHLSNQYSEAVIDIEGVILEKDWIVSDIIAQKKELGIVNPEYLKALNKSNPRIFEKTHPDLFA